MVNIRHKHYIQSYHSGFRIISIISFTWLKDDKTDLDPPIRNVTTDGILFSPPPPIYPH